MQLSKERMREYQKERRQRADVKEKDKAYMRTYMRNNYQQKDFIAIDGEGWDRDKQSRPQDYILLADSQGREVYNVKGIPTKDCLEFILNAPQGYLVGYGLNYDINQWLKDVPFEDVYKLYKGEEIFWDSYKLRWFPSKIFVVNNRSVYDVLGYFQQRFLAAIKDWKVGTPDELVIIGEMKEMRGTFTDETAQAVREYNRLECKLLVELMNNLRDALTKLDPPINLKKWHGAATIAKHILGCQNVDRFHTDKYWATRNPAFKDAVLRAYFGGWFRIMKQGYFETVYNADLNSAYPHAMLELPSMRGRERYVTEYSDHPYAIWHIKWDWTDLDFGHNLRPLPFREASGSIEYPNKGEGFYHSVLVNEVRKHFPVEVIDGWLWEPANDEKPFRFIPPLAKRRLEYKEAGDARNKPLKLGLNSMYGVTIDGRGQGRFRSLVWAGMITSHTRAAVLKAAMQAPDKVIAFATDGVLSTAPLPVKEGSWLGEWEKKVNTDALILQTGVYSYVNSKGYRVGRTRGLIAESVDWDLLIKKWHEEYRYGFTSSAKRRAFTGIGTAHLRKKPQLWRRWVEEEKEVSGSVGSGFLSWPGFPFEGTPGLIIDVEPWPECPGVSAPYAFQGDDGVDEDRIAAAEQADYCE